MKEYIINYHVEGANDYHSIGKVRVQSPFKNFVEKWAIDIIRHHCTDDHSWSFVVGVKLSIEEAKKKEGYGDYRIEAPLDTIYDNDDREVEKTCE